jgi:hypothetical protein
MFKGCKTAAVVEQYAQLMVGTDHPICIGQRTW